MPLDPPPARGAAAPGVSGNASRVRTTARAGATLADELRRGHRRSIGWTVLLMGLIAFLASFVMLHGQATRHLDLVARSAVYNLEVAVAFRDAESAQGVLDALLERERLAQVEVVLADGRVLAQAAAPRGSAPHELLRHSVAALVPLALDAPLHRHDATIATVRVAGDGSQFAALAGINLVGALLTMAVAAALAQVFTRRAERRILAPLDTLRRVTSAVRFERAFDRRAPPLPLAEVDALGGDFNALLAKVEQLQHEMQQRHARLARKAQALSQVAQHDPLTGLANRTHFERRLEAAVAAAGPQGQLGVLYLDADGLKAANDRHGHAVGDRLLVEIGRRLREVLCDSDCIARLGGDEFAVLVAPLHQPRDLDRLGQKIEAAMAAPLDRADPVLRHVHPRLSVGHASYPLQASDAQDLLRRADASMYAVKRARTRERGRSAEPMLRP